MTSGRCNRTDIHEFLQDENATGGVELIEHLDVCEDCRRYLDSQIAEPEQWVETGRMLRPTEFDLDTSLEFAAGAPSVRTARQPLAIQAVLDSLTPSEDPHRLGRLGNYEVSAVIGAGGMGVVLKAMDPSLDRVVAIKVLAPNLANSGTARKRFAREAKAAAAVLHPNVISIHSVSDDETMPYLVMSYIRGGSLQTRLENEGPLPTLEILRIGSQIAAGLAAAHEQGLVHRDIKPENILLEEGVERITLTDFGLARAVDDASLTREGAIAGTPQYMSPEQARGESIDQLSDLFSLGSVLYALATGRPPFRGSSSYGVMRRISDETPTPIRDLNPEIPEWLAAVIDQLMAKEKEARFVSANEVHALLDVCISHLQQRGKVDLHDHSATICQGVKRPVRRFGCSLKTILIGATSMTLLTTLFVLVFAAWMPMQESANETEMTPKEKALVEALKLASEDTEYAPDYAEEHFQAIVIGESLESVEARIGKPLGTREVIPYTAWLYAPAKHPQFAESGVYPSIEHACNVITFDGDGVFTGSYGQGPGTKKKGAEDENVLIVSAPIPIHGVHPGPLAISNKMVKELRAKKASMDEVRKRFGEPQAKHVSRTTKWLMYSRSPSGGDYRQRWLGIDKDGKVCAKKSEFYWD